MAFRIVSLRVPLLVMAEAVSLLFLPFVLLSRIFLLTPRWLGCVSIWTGAPIITIPKKCRAEKTLGFNSVSVVRDTYFITDEFDWVLARLAGNRRVIALPLTYLSFLVICLFATQVHAYADGGILPTQKRRQFSRVELLAYKLLGIRLMIWTYGADVRSRGITQKLGNPNCCSECPSIGTACICDADCAKRNYSRVASGATMVFSMGDMIEYTPGSRSDLFFWPIDLSLEEGNRYLARFPDTNEQRPLRVVHAPNHREFKGTRYLEEAVQSLCADGLAIELVLVEGVPNQQALAIYRSADVIFDQCLIGFHGYFALEAMALGKPVMCFIRKPEKYILHPEECPIINTHVETLKEDLRSLVEHRSELEAIGRQGRRYIEKYFSLEAFAERLQRAYRDLGIVK